MASFLNKQDGQVGLIVLMVMVTMLSVGIGAVAQSTRDLKITRQELEASQVLNAAEAGIEAGLADLEGGIGAGGVNGSLDVDGVGVDYGVEGLNEINMVITEGSVVSVNVAGATDSPLAIDWGQGQDPCLAANLVVVVYNNGGAETVARRYGLSGCSGNGSNFDVTHSPSSGYAGSASLTLLPGDVVARIRPIGGDVDVRATSTSGGFGVQSYRIASSARRSGSNETRAVEVLKSLPGAPSIFDYALFSGTTMVQ